MDKNKKESEIAVEKPVKANGDSSGEKMCPQYELLRAK